MRRIGSATVLVCVGAALLAFVIHRIATTEGIGITPDASDAPTIAALLGLVVITRERNAVFYARP